MISGFTFGHNLISTGYPIAHAVRAVQPYVDEVVAVDMQSDDGTREVLRRLGCRVIDGEWSHEADVTLDRAWALQSECQGDVIVHFEADEVFDELLIDMVTSLIRQGHEQLRVYRLQTECNFQRIRWYPWPVHRVYRKGSMHRAGHTTQEDLDGMTIPTVGTDYGYLWDCTACFRDQWLARVRQQAAWWNNSQPVYRRVPLHFLEAAEMEPGQVEAFLAEPQWTWKTTPLAIPEILRELVGQTRYEAGV